MQEHIEDNLSAYLGGCEKIGQTIAKILFNNKADMVAKIHVDLLHTALASTVTAWVLLADASLNKMVTEARKNTVPDLTSPKRPCKAHCTLMGIIACFTQCDVRCDVTAVISVIQRLLWCLIVTDDEQAKRIPKAFAFILIAHLTSKSPDCDGRTMLELSARCRAEGEKLAQPTACGRCSFCTDTADEGSLPTQAGVEEPACVSCRTLAKAHVQSGLVVKTTSSMCVMANQNNW